MNIPYTKAKHAEFKRIEGGGTSLELLSIYIDTPPDKTEYAVEDTFTLDGLKVIATYSDDYYKDVTDLVVSSIPEGYEFTEEDEGEETVTLTYSQSGVTKTASFGIEVVSERDLSYSIDLNFYNYSSYVKVDQRHLIPCKDLKSIVIDGTIYAGKLSYASSSEYTAYAYIQVVSSDSEFCQSYSTVKSLATWTIKYTSSATRTLSSTTFDIDTETSGADKSKCYILFRVVCPDWAYATGYGRFNITLTSETNKIDLIAQGVDATYTNSANIWKVATAKTIKSMSTKTKGQSNLSSQNPIHIFEKGYQTGASSTSISEEVSYTSTGEYEKDWSILSSGYDMDKEMSMNATFSTTSTKVTGYIKYSLKF